MISIEDVAGIVLEALRSEDPAPRNFRKELEREPRRHGKWGEVAARHYNKPYTSLPARRIFLSEYEIKRILKKGDDQLTVPNLAILSPLAVEWLETRKIKIEYR